MCHLRDAFSCEPHNLRNAYKIPQDTSISPQKPEADASVKKADASVVLVSIAAVTKSGVKSYPKAKKDKLSAVKKEQRSKYRGVPAYFVLTHRYRKQ